MSLFEFQNKNKNQHYSKKHNVIEKLMFLNSYDNGDFILLDSTIIDLLGFSGDEENMLFIIENMEGISRGTSIHDKNCNFTVTDEKIFLKKRTFQHFMIISDAINVKDYFIDANRVMRESFCIKTSMSSDTQYNIKELTEQNYKKFMKSYNERDNLIDLMESAYSYLRCNNENSHTECIYCYIENEIRKDFSTLEHYIVSLNDAFEDLKYLINKG